MKRIAIFCVLAFVLIAGSTSSVMAQSSDNSETYIILYDESHQQFFTTEMMETVLDSLNSSLDYDGIDVTVELVVQTDSFNSTNLQGVDLALITNPGLDDEGNPAEVTSGEQRALENFANIGGSIFWMSNPMSHNATISGHGEPLNELIFSSFGANVQTAATGDTDNTTVIVDDFNYVNNNTFVKITPDNFNQDLLVSELNNLTGSEFVYYGTQVTENTLPGELWANASDTSYVFDKNFEVDFFQQGPNWLFGNPIGDGGRGLLSGSTIMFSDYQFDSSTNWVDQGDNLGLFQNMIAWLLGITPQETIAPIVEEDFNPFFVRTNILYALLLGGGLFIGFIAVFAYQNRLKFNNLLDIFNKKEGSSENKTKSKGKSKSTKSESKSKRRKRT